MADFGSPVVNAGNAFNPMQSMSEVLGIKQRQQALQVQQQVLQTGAAALQMKQIDAQKQAISFQEQQNLGRLDPKKYIGKDGMLDADTYAADALKAAPFSGLGQDRAQKMYEARGAQLSVQSAAQGLNEAQRKDATNRLETATETSNGQPLDLFKVAEEYKKENPVAAPVMDAIMGNIKPEDTWEATQHKVRVMNLALKGVGTPAVGTQYDKSGNLVGTAQSGVTGKIQGAGGGVAVGLGPTEQPGYKAQIASATSRAAGVASSDMERNNQVSSLIQPSKAGISITKEIDDMADQVHSGKFASVVSKAAAAAGISEETYARQVLEKDLGRLRQVASEGAGSDERARTIISGLPTAESDNQTIHNATDFARGTFRQNLARGDLLNKVKTKDSSLQGFQHADDTLTASSDPLMHEFQALKAPQERIDFYKRHFKNAAEAQDFRNKVAGMGHVLGN